MKFTLQGADAEKMIKEAIDLNSVKLSDAKFAFCRKMHEFVTQKVKTNWVYKKLIFEAKNKDNNDLFSCLLQLPYPDDIESYYFDAAYKYYESTDEYLNADFFYYNSVKDMLAKIQIALSNGGSVELSEREWDKIASLFE